MSFEKATTITEEELVQRRQQGNLQIELTTQQDRLQKELISRRKRCKTKIRRRHNEIRVRMS